MCVQKTVIRDSRCPFKFEPKLLAKKLDNSFMLDGLSIDVKH